MLPYVNSLRSVLQWRPPINYLPKAICQFGQHQTLFTSNRTLWPAFSRVSDTVRRPLMIGGCGPTALSVQNTPSFRGTCLLAEPSDDALASVESTMSWRHGMFTTHGSRSHGLVESKEVISSFKASRDVPRTPTVEGYVV